MVFLLLSFLTFIAGAIASSLAGRRKSASLIGPAAAFAGCLLALYPTLAVLLRFEAPIFYAASAYSLPIGAVLLRLDPLAALFLIPTLLVGGLCACYGSSYLSRGMAAKKNLGAHWFFYNMLMLGLVLTFVAADAFLFMVAWEIMSLSPFFLVIFNDEEEQVRKGATSYLIAAHIGALFLLAFFILLSANSGGALDFESFAANARNIKSAGLLFVFALIGFGTKAGIMPMHVWLPEAHPAAPGHISAVMSGVMINTGIYGIVRALAFLGPSQSWWAFTLITAGVFSAALGIFFALTKKSIKRALAFSSIENMGIVCMALGFSLYAAQEDKPILALLCAMGGLIHLVNHSLYKSLLFLSAGAVSKGTGTDLLNKLGGLQKRAPFLGFCFFAGSAAICALPPLNGFAGKFILYVSFALGGSTVPTTGFLFWGGLFVLASVSGFSLFCFTRLFGLAFLGAPRSEEAASIRPLPAIENYTLVILIALCFLFASLAPFIAQVFAFSLEPYIHSIKQLAAPHDLFAVSPFTAPLANIPKVSLWAIYETLAYINIGFSLFVLLAFIVYKWRQAVLRSRTVSSSPTWDCGYAAPTARIQYTGGSFSQPAIYYTGLFLKPKAVVAHFASHFPSSGKAELSTEDWIKTSLYTRTLRILARIALWTKRLQQGRTNTYILYIFITLVALLAWKIR